jgi:ABC-type dipeptide/oligopeptide/nickel transport system permease component
MSARYLTFRLLDAAVTVLAMSVLVFIAVRILPADPVLLLAGEYARPGELEAIRAELGLDRPIPEQYARWLAAAVVGDLGRSIRTQRPVSEVFLERIPATIQLAGLALVLGIAMGLPLGVLGAIRRNTWLDRFVRIFAVSLHSTPNFFLGLLLILLFAVILGWLPAFGQGDWRNFVLPGLTLSTFVVALVARIGRASMLEVLSADYVRTAHAKGLPTRTVIWRHALRNALIPVVTVVGLQFGNLVGGAIVTETVFAWPGIGSAAYQAILERDYPIIQAIVLYVALGVACVHVLVDFLYTLLTPQVRFD